MKIIILGAGQVGATLAEHLASEHNDITIIDTDSERLRSLQERLDVLTITGNGAYPLILRRSRAEEADMLIAVTSSDETNLVACQVASSLFQIPTKIARIRSLNYLMHEELFGKSGFPIDVLISPEQLISNYVRRMIEYPDALQVVDFSDQKLQLISVKIRSSNVSLVGPSLRSFSTCLPNTDVEIAAIFRQGNAIMPNGSTTIENGDEVLFLANKTDSRQILSNLISLSPPNQRVIIAGGGNIGTRLASTLEKDFQIKIIEKNHSRVKSLATHITSGVVLHGDASDRELLLSENIENTDVFCAVTNRDETNIMAALLAKRLGARKVMALVNRPSYLELIEGGEIDTLISPQQVTIGSLLTHVRRGHIVNVHALHRGTAEAIEMIVEGSKKTSKIIGKRTKDISLPQEADIIAVIRGNKTFIGHQNVIIEAGDRVIILLLDKRKIRQVERFFQEGLSIFI